MMDKDMFDDRDYPTQWALHPSMYQNMSNDQVDWAALAQQWIKMKETVVPPAPPPPSLSDGNDHAGGEAPMDMDTIADDVPPAPPAPNISGNDNWNAWSQWGQWNTSGPGGGCWEWSGVPPPGVQLGPDGKPMGVPVPAAPNISRTGFNVPPPPPPPSGAYSYNSGSAQANFNSLSYWDNSGQPGSPPFKGIRLSRIHNIRGDLNLRDEKEKTPDEDTTMVIDAAKRRQLPAWIREGLEKMEREKHKAVERERQEMLRKQEMEARKLAEDEARAVLDPSKSKFDSESDKETEEQVIDEQKDTSPDIIIRQRKSRFRDADSPDARLINSESTSSGSITGVAVKRSREEILQDIMLKVRRSLTEILLEVTNEEISCVCREVWTRYRAKVPAGEPPVASYNNKAPLAQITRNLGLGIYGDSNSESEDEAESPVADDNDDEDDSDLELKETLKRRQAAFKKTEEEIEARIAEEEANELRNDDDKHENSVNNKTLDDKEVNNQRGASETQSSGGHTPRNDEGIKSSSRSVDSESSSSSSSSSSTTTETNSSSSRNKKRRSEKNNDRRKTRYRSRSSSHGRSKSSKKRSRDHKRRSHSSTRSRSRRSRSWSRRRRTSRSRSRTRSRSRHRSRSRNRSRRSRSYGRVSTSSSSLMAQSKSRRSRSRSRDKGRKRTRSRSRSRSRRRDGKKSSHRYRD
ncbi:arginine/serine-rich protein PNISR [Microplitis demolitor]|uniref:arginine/serine-rich protein PNISR n=1 Tax=Microplitis demolitor TaxID=69319 RepID=UPI00043FFFB4|nr:arginine/serine-rich protein PNISR [Microplitis demolitor]